MKILLDGVVQEGDLTVKQRDELLMSLADEVSGLVIADNYAQTQILSMVREQAPGMVNVHIRLIDWLEDVAGLDRQVECLPTTEQLKVRDSEGRGLTQPELAVVMAYTKLALTEAALGSDLPEEPAFDDLLLSYFPAEIGERFSSALASHPLRRDLAAMVITNQLINHAGVSMVHRLEEETSATMADIARAYAAAWRIYGLQQTWSEVDALDGKVDARRQLQMLLEIKRLAERATLWLVRYQPSPLEMVETVAVFETPVAEYLRLIPDVLAGPDLGEFENSMRSMVEDSVPAELAASVAGLSLAVVALDIADIARSSGRSVGDATRLYFEVDSELELSWLRAEIIRLPRDDRWNSLARSAFRDDFFRAHSELTKRLADGTTELAPEELVRLWGSHNQAPFDRLRAALDEVRSSDADDLARVSVALRELRNLADQLQRPAL